MAHNFVVTIEQVINKLRQLVQLEVQHSWRDITLLNIININSNLARINLQECPTASANEKGYIVFPQGRQLRWLAQKIVIPPTLQGYSVSGLSLRLVLTWWAEEAQIFINGELVQQGDLFDSSARVMITEDAQPGNEYTVAICLVSPNHDIGALMRSHLVYEKIDIPKSVDPGLVADELTVLFKYISQFEPENLEILATELTSFDWSNLQSAEKFARDLANLRVRLLPLAKNIKQRCFNLLGHAHLDMAWLWTTDETYEVAERTFKSVLSLQQDFPHLTFGHTSPALYEWMEINRPQLFALIKSAVKSNKWEVLGGMWIEPETNLVSGESLIRQLLYGQQYYLAKFGEISKIAWLPDSFGFTWQLPQIFKQCGIEYFVTGKLHWNDTTKFPLGCFWWESPDGTQLLTVMSPPNVTGVMDTNPITMTNYAIEWETQTGLQDIFWLPGVGDHGGGPTRDMLEVAEKWHNSPFFPEIEFSTATDYLKKISQPRNNNNHINNFQSSIPIWQDEIYLELHRGCYTTHGDQKKYNRYCERLLYQAELWSTWATLLCQDQFLNHLQLLDKISIPERENLNLADWQKLIEIAWKKVLFNQFHDILPGTSIPEVFTEANQDWETAIALGEQILQTALKAIASSIALPTPPQPDARPLVVFNSLNWERSEIVTVNIENTEFTVFDCLGNPVRSQIVEAVISFEGESQFKAEQQLIFLAEDIPSVGYRLFWLCPNKTSPQRTTLDQQEFMLENQYLKVVVDSETGNLNSIYDKQNRRELLSDPGNKLEAFADRGQYWDAWNIDPEYEQKQLPDPELKSIQWIEDEKLEQRIRVIKHLNQSEFIQDIILQGNSPILKIANTVDWQETHVMLKVAFPLNLNSDYVTCEIPCGTIARTTKPKTAADKAKWEGSTLNWLDLTLNNGQYGVSILNDCKYGYDAKPNQLRLTLLRSPVWPDPQSDRGIHHFTYAIYPHNNGWQSAKTVQKAYELNTSLQTVLLDSNNLNNQTYQQLSPRSELLNLSADNLILMALKLSKNQELIMRCYESQGEASNLSIKSDLNLQQDSLLDCLENKTKKATEELYKIEPYKIEPYKIVTLKLRTETDSSSSYRNGNS
ncbi:alpha-mannosidase [Pleurocapsa sp. PCC 7319]|uniref:alpha-mannosidase n=1 Tax=Pleurocapsa sp. PCC 7319 TaxID=118161 RepID=UPI000346531D|nr:alpha-mannosidase [Pleurocapsa sp. PCC 7319]